MIGVGDIYPLVVNGQLVGFVGMQLVRRGSRMGMILHPERDIAQLCCKSCSKAGIGNRAGRRLDCKSGSLFDLDFGGNVKP